MQNIAECKIFGVEVSHLILENTDQRKPVFWYILCKLRDMNWKTIKHDLVVETYHLKFLGGKLVVVFSWTSRELNIKIRIWNLAYQFSDLLLWVSNMFEWVSLSKDSKTISNIYDAGFLRKFAKYSIIESLIEQRFKSQPVIGENLW